MSNSLEQVKKALKECIEETKRLTSLIKGLSEVQAMQGQTIKNLEERIEILEEEI